MALKTNYKDDVFSGNRKYNKIDNADGTISLVDATTYTTVGDTFGATDVNAITTQVNGLVDIRATRIFTITASGWSTTTTTVNGRAFYTQVLTMQAIYDENPTVDIYSTTVPTEDQQNAYNQVNYMYADTTAKTITCYAVDKPTVDFQVKIWSVK